MFNRTIIRSLKQVNASAGARTFASASTNASKKQPSSIALAMGGAAFVGGFALTSMVEAKEKKADVSQIKTEIVDIFDANNYMGPTFVRLAWHASGTFSKHDGSGGSTGGTIRLKPEIEHGANAGLHLAIKALEKVKAKHPEITYADLFVLAGVTAIEEMGGPTLPYRLGRPDADSSAECTPNGRLPDADKGAKPKTINHIRDIFYRMGFNDREIVALLGAHAIGRCHPDRSGYSGPWTNAEWTFSNEYFVQLLENKWTIKKWSGPEQYEDPTGKLMMLPSDMALLWDPEFKKYVELYAKDEDLWFKDFSAAFVRLTENGVKFPEKTGWRKYIFFGPRGD